MKLNYKVQGASFITESFSSKTDKSHQYISLLPKLKIKVDISFNGMDTVNTYLDISEVDKSLHEELSEVLLKIENKLNGKL